MSFPNKVKEEVLVACGRHCALCHSFCGIKIELHHIQQSAEGGKDTFENCIPLCFNCHGDMRSYDHKHPRGTKYTEDELKSHRDMWYTKVQSSSGLYTSSEYAELDKLVYRRIREILAWDGVIFFMKNHPFGASFYQEDIKPLHEFCWRCEDPSFEFLDADLESARANLRRSIGKFLSHIGQHIWMVEGRSERLSVPHRITITDEQEEEWDIIIEEIDSDSQKVVEMYETLVKLAKRKLAIAD